MIAAVLALAIAAAPEGPIQRVVVDGELRVEVVVGKRRGVEAAGPGVEVLGPTEGVLRLVVARPVAALPVAGPPVDGTPVGAPPVGARRGGGAAAAPRAEVARGTTRVFVDATSLEIEALRGARVRILGERVEALTLHAAQTSRLDASALLARKLSVSARDASRVRARGESAEVRASRAAQVVLLGKPKSLEKSVADAARLSIEP